MSQRDIDTDRIERAVEEVQSRQQRHHSGEHRMEDSNMADRMTKAEATLESHTTQLGEGARQFVRLEMGLANVAEKVGELIGVLRWAAFGLASFVFLICAGAVIYVIVISGGKAVGVTP